MKILLVDDSGFSRSVVKKSLQSIVGDEATFFEAGSGRDGIAAFEKEKPDLVILDLLMPDITGEEMLKEIRTMETDSFVVILTSNFQKPVRERLLVNGADFFMEKSITHEKLSKMMDSFRSKQ